MATIYRQKYQKLKKENPAKYEDILAKQRIATKKYKDKKRKQWEEGTHTQAEIEAYMAEKEKKRQYARDYYLTKKTQASRQTRNSASATPTTSKPEKTKKLKEMSPNERRKYFSSQRRAQREALSHQKKTAIRLKERERQRKKREEAKLLRLANSPASTCDGPKRLKQSAYNLNYEFKSKTKQLGLSPMEYAQTTLNLLNPRTPVKQQAIRELQRKHPCRSLFTEESDHFNVEEELGIQLQDVLLDAEETTEEVGKPLHNKVQLFYQRCDVSRILPHARYSTKHGAARVMQVTIKRAYEMFREENPTMLIGLTTFQNLRPKNVRLLGSVPVESCLCIYCTNVRLMINALNRHLGTSGQLPSESAMLGFLTCPTMEKEKLPNIKCIDGACKVCLDRMRPFKVFCRDIYGCQDVVWKKWTRIDGKFEPIERKGSIRDLLSDLQSALEEPTKGTSFVQHLYVAFWQQSQFKICKTNPEENELVMVQDFGENRKAAYAEEVKSAHFGKSQITVHPVVCFYRCGEQVIRESLIFLSDDICHDHHAVKSFTMQALDLLKKKTSFSKVTIWSDGAASQYKGKGTFCDLSNMLGLDVQRCYFGSEHGKNESDGETGILSQAIKRAVHEGISFRNASDMVVYLSKLNTNPHRQYILVNNIVRDSTNDDSLAIPGSRKLHQYQRLAAYVLRARRLCCFCCACRQNKFNNCINADIVGEYEIHKLKPNVNVILNNGFLEDPDVQRESSVPEPESPEHRLKVGDYVKLQCSVNKVKKIFYAVVIVAPTEQSADFSVRYLQKSGTSYVFGNQVDEGLIAPGPPDYYTWEFIQPDKYRLDNRGHHFFGI